MSNNIVPYLRRLSTSNRLVSETEPGIRQTA